MRQLAAEARAGGAALAVFVFLLLGQEAQGQCLIEQKVTASDGSAFAQFGCVGAHLDTLVVGAPLDDERGVDAGAVYLFDRNLGGIGSWGESRKLTALDGDPMDEFGRAARVFGNTLVVGAPRDDLGAGSVYIFDRNLGGVEVWGQRTKLTAANRAPGDQFGHTVSIYGDTIVVGAPGADAAYVFERDLGGADVWGQARELSASDGALQDSFGISVSVFLNTVLVGAHQHDHGATDSGAAYVFLRDHGGAGMWGEAHELTHFDPLNPGAATGDHYGFSVSVGGNTIAIGVPLDAHTVGPAAGSLYIYEHTPGTWDLVSFQVASDAAPGDQLGYSVDRQHSIDKILVSAPRHSAAGTDSGSAYFFDRNVGGTNNFGEIIQLSAEDASAGDLFGSCVALADRLLVVGASYEDSAGVDAGSVYLFDTCFPIGLETCPANPNSVSAGGASISPIGSPSISANTVLLVCNDLPPGQPGLFFHGATPSTNPLGIPLGEGRRCITGTTVRMHPFVTANSAGRAQAVLDNMHPLQGAGILAGVTQHFQFWYRDPAAGDVDGDGASEGFNLSNAIGITFGL